MRLSNLVGPVASLFRERRRRSWVGETRAHIEFRNVTGDELGELTTRLKAVFDRLDRVRWVEVNPHTRRVVVQFDRGAYTEAQLVELVEEAERGVQLTGQGFFQGCEHPADDEPALRTAVELAADVVGLAIGASLSASPLPRSGIASNVASVLSVLRSSDRLRLPIDERLGPERSELVINLATALAQGLAQRPVSAMVDVAHKSVLLRETRARREVWARREPELCSEPADFDRAEAQPGRPVPLPSGPIEEYADRAWMLSLGGFALSFLTTRSVQRAVAALFGGLPKPARFGREVYTAELSRVLAGRDILVRDPSALRRLDRVDCIVLQGDLVPKDKFVIGEVATEGEVEPEAVRKRASELFDPESPLAVRRDGDWVLGPSRLLDATVGPELARRAEALAGRGALVLKLARAGEVAALVEVQVIPQTGIEELIEAAHAAEMRVVIASDDESLLEGLNADDVVPAGEGLRTGVRRLQREGRVVATVATGRSPGLPISDVGIGLCRAGEPVPWGAHVICGEDMSDVRFLLESAVMARMVSKQSVNVTLGAATLGALASAGGLVPMTTQRVMFIVNSATLISMANAGRRAGVLSRKALPPPRDPTPWHALDASAALARLRSSDKGLSARDVVLRVEHRESKKSAIVELSEAVTDELFNPLAPILAAGAGLSAVVGSTGDAGMVASVVGLNALVGGVQRFRTERAIRDLSLTTRRRAIVLRNGTSHDIDASELVRGDVLLLGPGDIVPADCRVIDAQSLEVDGSSLTGESLPVRKTASASFDDTIADRSSMLYEGTSVAAGRAKAVVVAVGDATEARRASAAAKADPAMGGVEKRLRSLMALTAPVAGVAAVGTIGAGLLRGRRFDELVGSGVSLAVASVPEGLPLLATAAQLSAADRLSKRGALVRNSRCIEALGRVDVLCLDKTGTVTEGRIELAIVSDGDVEEVASEVRGRRVRVLAAALRATPESPASGAADPTDSALVRGAERATVRRSYDCEGWSRLGELSFEAGRSYHAVLAESDAGVRLSVKGAPEVLIPRCTRCQRSGGVEPLNEAGRHELADAAVQLARRGLRVLAVAERLGDAGEQPDPDRVNDLTFAGFVAFNDPVRPSAIDAIRGLRRAGVELVMITGDHPSTAEAIATELEMLNGRRVVTGAQLALMGDDDLDACIREVAVFARVTPSQKVRIVRALQRAGRVVAMVGDGANDAPAIRLADVGVAIGERSTAAARGAADMIVTDERIETLIDAIAEGRAMWSSVRDAVSILVGGNLGEIGFTLGAGLIDGRPPLNARQVLLVNLLTDVAPAMAVALRPPSAELLETLAGEGPEASLGTPLTRDLASRALVTAGGAGMAWALGRLTGTASRARTMGLVALVGTQLGQTLIAGRPTAPIILTSVGSAAVLAAIVQTPGLSQFFGCRPLGPVAWTTALGASAAATGAAAYAPVLTARVVQRLRGTPLRIFVPEDPAALEPALS